MKTTSTITIALLFLLLSLPSMAQVTEADSLALVALYQSTNGDEWADNSEWLQGKIQDWKGVFLDNTKTRITSILLTNNNLTGTLPNDWNLPDLKWLNLSGNKIEGNIPNFNLPNLENLALSGNELEGEIPNFSAMPKLKLLTLADNQLKGTIPHFEQLPNLEWLNLGNNQLQGTIPDFGPYLTANRYLSQ